MNWVTDAELARLLNDDRRQREADLRTARDIDRLIGRIGLVLLCVFFLALGRGWLG